MAHNELDPKRIPVLPASNLPPLPSGGARNCLLSGRVNAGTGAPDFLEANGTGINLRAATQPLVLTFAAGYAGAGSVDHTVAISEDVTRAWDNLGTSLTSYLFIERNPSTGNLVYSSTSVAPVCQASTPGHSNGLYWFNPVTGITRYSYNADWYPQQVVFVGTATLNASGVVTAITAYGWGRVNLMGGTSTPTVGQVPVAVDGGRVLWQIPGVTLDFSPPVATYKYSEMTVNPAGTFSYAVGSDSNGKLVLARIDNATGVVTHEVVHTSLIAGSVIVATDAFVVVLAPSGNNVVAHKFSGADCSFIATGTHTSSYAPTLYGATICPALQDKVYFAMMQQTTATVGQFTLATMASGATYAPTTVTGYLGVAGLGDSVYVLSNNSSTAANLVSVHKLTSALGSPSQIYYAAQNAIMSNGVPQARSLRAKGSWLLFGMQDSSYPSTTAIVFLNADGTVKKSLNYTEVGDYCGSYNFLPSYETALAGSLIRMGSQGYDVNPMILKPGASYQLYGTEQTGRLRDTLWPLCTTFVETKRELILMMKGTPTVFRRIPKVNG